ncbi:hypothetical protein ACFVT5_00470 [Streptomyces sp. NPDC058001]|uniref:hypothetical protein n=1 Tax=Streptomyces sp. NPDC058001 TaxID=3346300 RepID=UPI0036E59E99
MKIQERAGAGSHRSPAPVQPPVGERLPSPPRERKPALAALAVLLILVGALGATVLVLRAGDRIEVVKVTADIEAGELVTKDKVTSVMVADDGDVNYIKWTQVNALVKLHAKSKVFKGTVVIGDMFSEKNELPDGKSNVGLSLKEGQYPNGLKPGDIVAAYQVGDSSSGDSKDGASGSTGTSGTPLVANALVASVKVTSDGTISSTNLPVTVTVDSADVAALARAAAAGDVAVVRVPSSGSAG